MATYTGIADANGDFTIPFLSNYTGGQKVTVTAEKDAAIKTIELFAPSDTTGGGVIQFTGSTINFPQNISGVIIKDVNGSIPNGCFTAEENSIWKRATSLTLGEGISSIGGSAFQNWSAITAISLPTSLLTIGVHSLAGLFALKKLIIPKNVTSINSFAFNALLACDEITCLPAIPPAAESNFLASLKSSCIIRVPSASLSAYQSAANWSVHAAKMVGI